MDTPFLQPETFSIALQLAFRWLQNVSLLVQTQVIGSRKASLTDLALEWSVTLNEKILISRSVFLVQKPNQITCVLSIVTG